MAWNQDRNASWKVPYTGGWCLNYVERAFGTPLAYPTAISAWQNANNKHTDLPPSGKTVPVYFTLGSEPAGHIAISLDDGKVASSTQSGSHSKGYIHPNLQDMINVYAKYNNGCTYLGWSEDLAGVTIVSNKGEDNMAIIQDADNWRGRCNRSFQLIRGRDMTDGDFKPFVGQDFLHFIEALEDDSNADLWHNYAVTGYTASKDNWQGQINGLTDSLKSEQSKTIELTSKIDTLNNDITTLNSTISEYESKNKQLNDQITELQTQIEELNNKIDGQTSNSNNNLNTNIISSIIKSISNLFKKG